MVAPSGEQYRIAGGGYRAVVTECGAGLRSLEYDGQPLVEGFAEDRFATAGRGQLLIPWPNRIQDGCYRFDGEEHRLALSEPARGNASHGLVRWTQFGVVQQSAGSVTLGYRLMAQSGYPWTLDLQVDHRLSAGGLQVTVTAANRAGSPAPYAQGAHPYLTVGDEGIGDWELTLPADTRLTTDDRLLPVGREPVAGTAYDFRAGRRLEHLVLDTAFTDLRRDSDGRAVVELQNDAAGRVVELWMDSAHRFIQVYSGDDLPEPWQRRRSLAVEPMTAPANAFRTGEDLIRLAAAGEDGDRHSSSWGIRSRGS